MLTSCCYSTRYPEAIPLKDELAETVAEALVGIFSRLGIPKVILSDQGTNFLSQLMTVLYKRLGVHKVRTSPYHPMANGLVERWNGTLKSMLKRVVQDEPKDWDLYLPYLLFAYREVPEASTGFSPFELLYGRAVRGPLAVLKESWTGEEGTDTTVVDHVLKMRERMAAMTELAHASIAKQQRRQRVWYDRGARDKVFEPGEEVLLLMPASSNKLQSVWQGPFKITRKVSPVDYEVDTGRCRKRLRTYHVNLLRKWRLRKEISLFAAEIQLHGEDTEAEAVQYLVGKQPTESWRDVKTSDGLSVSQHEEVRALLHEFGDIFSDKPGLISSAVHDVDTGDATLVRSRPYRVPDTQREPLRQHLKELEASGIIEPSEGEWGSPIVIIPKKDNTIRMAVDYRKLNALTKFLPYPTPRIEPLIERIAAAKYISKFDACQGYYQIPLTEVAKECSAFITPFGTYRFNTMPFGMVNAGARYQKTMDRELRGAEDYTASYVDDVAIYSKNFAEHRVHLMDFFTHMRKANIKLKPSKCEVGCAWIPFLGHQVGRGTLRPLEAKVEAIVHFPRPETKKNVRQFLGLDSYYRRYCPNYSDTAAPLSDLTKNGSPNWVKWSDECEASFRKLKAMLQSSPVLQAPDITKKLKLQVDTSERGLGAVLCQEDEDGEHPVVYCSRKLLTREQSLVRVEKECLGCVWAIQHLRPYLLGREFTLEVDHNPLVWLNRMKDHNMKLLRWSLLLQEHKITFHHKSGKDHTSADCLSRA